MNQYQLKLASGKTAVWEGNTPDEAIRRYLDCHRKEVVVAWRTWPRTGVFPVDPRHVRIVE